MYKERFYNWYIDCKESQSHIEKLQAMLEYTYNSRQFWLKMFWLQSITTYLILMFN